MRIAPILLTFMAFLAGSASAQDLFDKTKVRDFYFTFSQPNWWNDILSSQASGQEVKGDLVVDGITYLDVGLRIKGASSSSVPGVKKPFNLSMDAFTDDQDLYGFDTLNLNNGAVDPTFTREVISYEIFRNYLPAPRTAYVRVHLNGTFWGIYILVEQPDKNFHEEWWESDDGSRYKGDKPSGAAVNTSTLEWLGSQVSSYQSRYEIKTPSHPNAWTDLISMIDTLNHEPAATFKAEIEKVVNVDRAIWYFAVMNFVVNSDDYVGAGHNYYMYFDPSDGRMNMIPWDLNEAYGVHGPANNPWTYSFLKGSNDSNRPLVKRILEIPEWRELYFAHYRTIMEDWPSWSGAIGPLNTQLQNLIAADVAADSNYLYPTYFNPSFSGKVWLSFHWVHGLKQVVEGREVYLNNQPDLTKTEPQIDQVTNLTPSVLPGQPVQITAVVQPETAGSPAIASVELRASQSGVFDRIGMFDDGNHNDGAAGDNVYGGSFTAGSSLSTMRYYVHATNAVGTVQVEPKTAEHTFFTVKVDAAPGSGPVYINELLADNDNGAVDEAGDTDDWVEIYNSLGGPYDLSGHYLSDNAAAPKTWQVPPGTVIPGGGFVRVWADNEPGEGPLHATFKLDKDGEEVVLSDTDANGNALIDAVVFGDQKGDRAFGRVPDGGLGSFFLWNPTGGAPFLSGGDWNMYDGRKGASPADFELDASGVAKVGSTFSLDFKDGVPAGTAILLAGAAPGQVPAAPYGLLNLNPAALWILSVPLDATGNFSIAGPVPSTLAGATLYVQAVSQDLSNGLAIRFDP